MVVKSFKQKKSNNSNNTGFVCEKKKGMRVILLDDLDELNSLTDDLKILTYLQLLVQDDFAGGYGIDVFASKSKDMIDMYLLDLQMDKVKKLESLMEKICQ